MVQHCKTCTCASAQRENAFRLWIEGRSMSVVSRIVGISPQYVSEIVHEEMARRGHVLPEGTKWTSQRALIVLGGKI